MGADAEARKKAIGMYRILAIIQILLGVGLLICGGFGTTYDDEGFGPPFFLGGFLVGSMMLISALLCICVIYKGSDAESEIQRREVACGVMGQYILAMFTFMSCFISLVFAGIGGCDTFDEDEECSAERDIIRFAIIGGAVAAILTNIFSMYIVCTYGSYFGVVMTRGRRGRMVMSIDTTNNTAMYTSQPTGTYSSNFARNDARLQQLERENELLQRQLQLQREYNQQPPPYPAGYQPPDPPAFPPTTSFPDPTAPPPSYSSIGHYK